MADDYIPSAYAAFDAFQANLMSIAAVNLAAWGITVPVFQALEDLQDPWQTTHAVGVTPQGDNPVDNDKRRTAHTAYETGLRNFVNEHLRFNSKVTNNNRIAMGLTVPDTEPTDVPQPTTQPAITEVDKNTESRHIVHYKDDQTPESKAKPFGVHHVEIRYQVGGDAPANAEACLKAATDTETPVTIQFDMEDKGKTVYYFLRWVNNTSEPGPWSLIVTAVIT